MSQTQKAETTKTYHSPNYLAVFLVLAVITALITGIELYISYLSFIPQEYIHAMFVVMAVIKATLVAMYYMHLKFDSRIYTLLFGLPVLFAIGLVAILLVF